MATNTGAGFRRGAVTGRSQVRTPSGWVKRNSTTDRFMDKKSDSSPFMGVRREK